MPVSTVRGLRSPATALLLALAVVAALLAAARPAVADRHLEVVADHLDNPRHVDVTRDGDVVVAEAGIGGDRLADVVTGDGTNPVCAGRTGRVSVFAGGDRHVLERLPSWAAATEDGTCPGAGVGTAGPHGVAVHPNGKIAATIGLGGDPAIRDAIADVLPSGRRFAMLRRYHDGRTGRVRDLGDFEVAADSDGKPDTNPYGVTVARRGLRLVADAGANALLRVHPGGATEIAAVFAPACVEWTAPFPNPIPDDENPCGDAALFPAEAVPTDVAVAPDGDYLVTELRGFPFTVGTSRIWKIDAHRDHPAVCSTFPVVAADGCEVHADGLTALVSLAVDRDGTTYAVQLADEGVLALESGAPTTGSIQVIPWGAAAADHAIEGLPMPGGVAVRDDDLYATLNSVLPGAGQVVRMPVPPA